MSAGPEYRQVVSQIGTNKPKGIEVNKGSERPGDGKHLFPEAGTLEH